MTGKQKRNGFNGPLQTQFQDFMSDWVFATQMSAQDVLDTYFTDDFSAEIDGHILSKAQFQSRIDRMRQDADVHEQDFVEMMEDGDRLFSMHYTRGRSRVTDQPFETRAIAFFLYEGNKMKKGYLNSATLGDPRDADFASRS
ncbi:MAG: nuclear transport factor 2 family protein [Roseibium sp.]|uniref:nuclear transport factor 2 family protein n=1 Tax=Roseibium sp. TaxID=1936156 RepID=UPI002627BA64|nr:nuclear transport factor 2 family protein [Roseibium sp.]MCV0426114.1 nuclear transport factor 2 family protein [Roseibium sp.]